MPWNLSAGEVALIIGLLFAISTTAAWVGVKCSLINDDINNVESAIGMRIEGTHKRIDEIISQIGGVGDVYQRLLVANEANLSLSNELDASRSANSELRQRNHDLLDRLMRYEPDDDDGGGGASAPPAGPKP
jgi:hypothetical protein